MELSHLVFLFCFAAFVYLILAGQLYFGSLPLHRQRFLSTASVFGYRQKPEAPAVDGGRQILRVVISVGAFVGGMVAAMPIILFVSGVASIWAGLSFRKDLQSSIDGPPEWLLNPLYVPEFVMRGLIKQPMRLFDYWTVGISGSLFIWFIS